MQMWRRGIITVIAAGAVSECDEEKKNPETHEGWEVGDCVTFEEGVPTAATFRLDMLSTIAATRPGYRCVAIDERGVRRQPPVRRQKETADGRSDRGHHR